jgi:hypothetical protein
MNKNQLIFLHIPKTAGTTLRNIVYAQYGEKKIAPIYPEKQYIETKEFDKYSPERKDQADVIIGHFKYGFHERLSGNRPYRYATMLRDPMARCLSLYNHLKNKPIYNSLSFKELLQKPVGSQFINDQVLLLSGKYGLKFKRTSKDLLKIALENIENDFTFVGIAERFNESMLLARHQLHWKLHPYEIRNTGQQWPINYAEELQNNKEAMEMLLDLNDLDSRLYEYIDLRFSEILHEQILDWQDQLIQYKSVLSLQPSTVTGVGNLSKLRENRIVGWAKLLRSDNPALIGITINNGEELAVLAEIRRENLLPIHYTGRCGFVLNLPSDHHLKKGDCVNARILNAGDTILRHSPRLFGEK